MVECKKCGAEIEDGMMFCSECGARQEAWPEMKPRFCGKCGVKMTGTDHKLCADCRGRETTELQPQAPQPAVVQPEIIPEPTPEPIPEAPQFAVVQPEVIPEPTPEPTPDTVPETEPQSKPTPPAQPEPEAKQKPEAKIEAEFEPAPFAKKPGSKGKTAQICMVILLIIIACEVLYYLFGMGGVEQIKAVMAKPQPTASVGAPSQTSQSSQTPQSSQSSHTAEPPSSSASVVSPTSEPTVDLPPLPTVAEAAPVYHPIDLQLGSEMQQKYKATGAEFIPIAGAQELMELDEGIARIKINGKWGFSDNLAEDTVNALYDELRPFVEDRAAARIDNKWGYVKKENIAKAADCQWDSASDYHEGYAVVSRGSKIYIIDAAGSAVMEPDYEKVRACGSGLFPVLRDGKWGYIDIYDRVVIPFDYDDAGSFASARAVVVKGGKAFFIDTLGNAVTREYDDAWGFNENHTAKVQTNYKYGLITTNGDFLIRPEWDNIWNLQEGVATVQKGGNYGYVSQTDNTVVVQPVYSDVWSSSFGLIPVKAASGKWGYVDRVGNTVIEPQFDDAYIFGSGAARVSRDGNYGLIDLTGKDICGFDYKQMGYIREGYCPAMNADGVWGYLKITY